MSNRNDWFPEEDAILREASASQPPASSVELAALLPRHSASSIRKRRWRLGLAGPQRVAISKPSSDRPEAGKMRFCLGHLCGHMEFWSTGAGHRLCQRCTRYAEHHGSAPPEMTRPL